MKQKSRGTSAEGNGFPTGGHGKKVFVPKFQEILGQELLIVIHREFWHRARNK
jgi:hypothetical protein